MTELRTKNWKCENIRRMASAYNNLVGYGRGMKDSNFKKKTLLGSEEKQEKKHLKKKNCHHAAYLRISLFLSLYFPRITDS
jgi:hypothetical protein